MTINKKSSVRKMFLLSLTFGETIYSCVVLKKHGGRYLKANGNFSIFILLPVHYLLMMRWWQCSSVHCVVKISKKKEPAMPSTKLCTPRAIIILNTNRIQVCPTFKLLSSTVSPKINFHVASQNILWLSVTQGRKLHHQSVLSGRTLPHFCFSFPRIIKQW